MAARDQSRQFVEAEAGYNSRNCKMVPSSRLHWVYFALLIFSSCAFASDWQRPAVQLATKISAITGPGVIALQVTNRSTIAAADVEQIRRAVVAALADAGVRVWEAERASSIAKITLSENLQSYVWVAEIQQAANENAITMISLPRRATGLAQQNALPVTIRVERLLSRAEPILDFAVLNGAPRRALILGERDISLYEFKDGKWTPVQSIPISHARPFPRDLRGRIILRKERLFDAYLPGVLCTSTNSVPLTASCVQNDDPWPLREDSVISAFFAPTRNFFTGALVPGIGKQRSAPAFYSAAAVPREKYTLWVFSGVDGQLYLLDGVNQTEARVPWGSSIAGVHASCRSGWQVLSSALETSNGDSVQAFEFPDREPQAVSQRLPVNGTIVALWGGTAQDSANLVDRSFETGDYEAVQLTVNCHQ